MLVVLVVALVSRTRVQHRLFSGTGIDAWREEASGFSWRDRWTLHRTTMRGRPAPDRLAAPAARRAAVMLAMSERMLKKKSSARRIWQWLGILWAGLGVIWVVLLLAGAGTAATWLNLLNVGLGLLAVYVAIGPWQRRQARLLRRSLEANLRQIEGLGREEKPSG